jgi:hypothetical protein
MTPDKTANKTTVSDDRESLKEKIMSGFRELPADEQREFIHLMEERARLGKSNVLVMNEGFAGLELEKMK